MSLSKDIKFKILNYLKQPIPQNENMEIVKQSIPVPFFGNIEDARVATISINPSFGEFEKEGKLLEKSNKRFDDREILEVRDTSLLNQDQAEKVYDSLIHYFSEGHRPYMQWFGWLEKYAGKIFESSYYDGTMVHLDIYPWATKKIWSKLDEKQREKALQDYSLLKDILKEQHFKYIYINGKEVKEQIEKYFKVRIPEYKSGQWTIYKYVLNNGTKMIGSSCYLKNAYKTREELIELHNILSENL